ncbi:hypothetical protein [Polyangium sp. 15x6]|nr:hypothetical protein [Polyangium sp. 15x6]MDI3282100.1 hypothetical protein [Polyangium sp. 15x6]
MTDMIFNETFAAPRNSTDDPREEPKPTPAPQPAPDELPNGPPIKG